MNRKQEWERLNRRLNYPGGRKARRAERRIRDLVRSLVPVIRRFFEEAAKTNRMLLAGVGVHEKGEEQA